MSRIRPTTTACFKAIQSPELYRNFAIHAFVMFPSAMLMCWLGTRLDAALGWMPLPYSSVRHTLGTLGVIAGGIWVWYVYGYLFIAGGGSPGTHVDGGPTRLVDTGPYAVIRHPSVLGKLLGVISLGTIWGSTSFLIFFVPILWIYAFYSNRWIQERFCHLRFGAEYAHYCETVPMFIPTLHSMKRWSAGTSVLSTEHIIHDHVHPTGIWNEFRWYLLGLFGLLGIFSGIVWLNQ